MEEEAKCPQIMFPGNHQVDLLSNIFCTQEHSTILIDSHFMDNIERVTGKVFDILFRKEASPETKCPKATAATFPSKGQVFNLSIYLFAFEIEVVVVFPIR